MNKNYLLSLAAIFLLLLCFLMSQGYGVSCLYVWFYGAVFVISIFLVLFSVRKHNHLDLTQFREQLYLRAGRKTSSSILRFDFSEVKQHNLLHLSGLKRLDRLFRLQWFAYKTCNLIRPDDLISCDLYNQQCYVVLSNCTDPHHVSNKVQIIYSAPSTPGDTFIYVDILQCQDRESVDHFLNEFSVSISPENRSRTAMIMSTEMRKQKIIRHALECDNVPGTMFMVYQPIVDLDTGEVLGFEALLRWVLPDIGFVPPDQLIETAEKLGIIHKINQFVFNYVACFLVTLHDLGHMKSVSVNIAPNQLVYKHDILLSQLDGVKKYLLENGVDVSYFKIEITEFDEHYTDSVLNVLSEICARDFILYIDDYGVKASTPERFARWYPYIHGIKVDKVLMDHIGIVDLEPGSIIIGAMLYHARGTRIRRIVLEGMEEFSQLLACFHILSDDLRLNHVQEGVIAVQGYLFSRPLSEKDALLYLENNVIPKKNN